MKTVLLVAHRVCSVCRLLLFLPQFIHFAIITVCVCDRCTMCAQRMKKKTIQPVFVYMCSNYVDYQCRIFLVSRVFVFVLLSIFHSVVYCTLTHCRSFSRLSVPWGNDKCYTHILYTQYAPRLLTRSIEQHWKKRQQNIRIVSCVYTIVRSLLFLRYFFFIFLFFYHRCIVNLLKIFLCWLYAVLK